MPAATPATFFDKQGHRGCRGIMPENTIPAMLKAVDLGVTTLEMDVVITKDRQVILSHDPFFSHHITTKPNGHFVKEEEEKKLNIFQMTYEEVQQYDVGMKHHPGFKLQQKMKVTKPLLADVIDSVEAYAIEKKAKPLFYNIETKSQPFTDQLFHPKPDEFVDLLMNVIRTKGIESRVIIQSFDFRTLQYLHQKFPFIKTAALIEDFDTRSMEEQIRLLGFVPGIYSPHYTLITASLVQACHQKGIKVIPWTVNEKKRINELKDLGVDGIITDYPDLFK